MFDKRLVSLTEALYSVVVLCCVIQELGLKHRVHPEANSARASFISRGHCSKYPARTSLLRIVWTARLLHEDRGTEESSGQWTTRVAGHLGGLFGGRLSFPPARHASGKDGGHCGWRPLFFLCSQRIGPKLVAFGFVASPIPSFDSGLHRNSLGTQGI